MEVISVYDNTGHGYTLDISTTTHGRGDRLEYLKRNLKNLDQVADPDWRQTIIIDHSPEKVVRKIVRMVKKSKHPKRRRVFWITGGEPTGAWGKHAHNFVLNFSTAPLFAFHCDDNAVNPLNYAVAARAFTQDPKLDIAWTNGIIFGKSGKPGYQLREWKRSEIDLGQPVFRVKTTFEKHLQCLAHLPDTYFWDWEMMHLFEQKGCNIKHLNFDGYYFMRDCKEAKCPS